VTFANVVACLALFFALGGTSMAQSGARSAVRLITGQEIKNGSLTGADIRDRSLLAEDFRAGQLPSGQDGATGATGAPGAAGAAGATGAAGVKGDPGNTFSAGTALTLDGGVLSVLFGTTAGTVAAGDDARLSDARTPAGAAGGDLTGSYPSPVLKPGSVGAGNLAADSVGSQHLASGSVGNSELATGSVTMTRLAFGAVDTAALAGNAVDSAKVAAGALNLTDLDSAQGTTVVDPPNLTAGTCSIVTTVVPSLRNNDRVMIFLDSPPSDASVVTPMTATSGTLRVRVCDHSGGDDDSSAFSLAYIVLR
jgi:hypothetical protein